MIQPIGDLVCDARPSRTRAFAEQVVLFAVIRHHDHDRLAVLLAADPSLVDVTESWGWGEALDVGLAVANAGTPLIRAVESGDVLTVELLVRVGAGVDGRWGCAGSETPLYAAG